MSTSEAIARAATSVPPTEDDRYYFDPETAARACKFFPSFLRHPAGRSAGERFTLEDWQVERIVAPLFGWKDRSTGLRRFRSLWLECPRSQGKTPVCSGLGLYLTIADNEPAPHVFFAGSDKENAKIAFSDAKMMASTSPALSKVTELLKESIFVPKSWGRASPISSEGLNKHGLRPHAYIADDVHAWQGFFLYEALHTAMGKRKQPIELFATTAGFNKKTIAWDRHEHALRVLGVNDKGEQIARIDDPTFLPVVYAAPKEADWQDPAVWAACNPNLGISQQLDYLEREAKNALNSPYRENSFRQLHLNQWVEQSVRWLSIPQWDKGAVTFDPETLKGKPCYLGVDLAEVHDLTALILLFPPAEGETIYRVLCKFYCPEDDIAIRTHRDSVPYQKWREQGFIKTTPGARTDFRIIESEIVEICRDYDVRGIGCDPWKARQMMANLLDEGLPVTEVRQGYGTLSAPTSELERLIIGEELHHGGNPILREHASNVTVSRDPAGNMKPDKAKSNERIDGIAGLVTALAVKLALSGVREPEYQMFVF